MLSLIIGEVLIPVYTSMTRHDTTKYCQQNMVCSGIYIYNSHLYGPTQPDTLHTISYYVDNILSCRDVTYRGILV